MIEEVSLDDQRYHPSNRDGGRIDVRAGVRADVDGVLNRVRNRARRSLVVASTYVLLGAAACADLGGAPAGTGSGGASGDSGNATGGRSGGGTGGAAGGGTGSGGMTGTATGGKTGSGGAPSGTGGLVSGAGGATIGTGGRSGTIVRVDLTGKKVLLIVGSTASPSTGDIAFQAFLADKGMVVTRGDATTVVPDAASMSLIVGSDTAGSDWPTLYKDIAVPIITFSNAFDFALGFIPTNSAKGSISTPGLLTIIDENTPLAASFPAGMDVKVIGTTRNTSYYWATPAGTVIRVAGVMGAPTQLGVFAFEKGAMMAVGTAAARRVALGWRTDFIVSDLAIEAFRIMNAAIEWTATAP
jgi:hypothetical protein